MYYPAPGDEEKRYRLGCLYQLPEINLDELDPDVTLNLTVRDATALACARSFDDFNQTAEQLKARGFYAAHWLRYRLYAARARPEVGSNNKWLFYVTDEIVHKLPDSWPQSRKKIHEARMEYAPVAHLWLAWFDTFCSGLDVTRIRAPAMRRSRERSFNQFLNQAAGYLDTAISFGLFDDIHARPSSDEVWRLPADIVPERFPEITSPDLMLEDFDPGFTLDRYKKSRKGELDEYEIEGEDLITMAPATSSHIR